MVAFRSSFLSIFQWWKYVESPLTNVWIPNIYVRVNGTSGVQGMNQQETGSFPTNFTPVKNNTGVFSHNQKLERGSGVESLVVSIQGINNTEIIPHLNTSMLSRPKKRTESFSPFYKALVEIINECVISKLFSLMLSTPRGSWISFSRPCFESQGEGEYTVPKEF